MPSRYASFRAVDLANRIRAEYAHCRVRRRGGWWAQTRPEVGVAATVTTALTPRNAAPNTALSGLLQDKLVDPLIR